MFEIHGEGSGIPKKVSPKNWVGYDPAVHKREPDSKPTIFIVGQRALTGIENPSWERPVYSSPANLTRRGAARGGAKPVPRGRSNRHYRG